MPDPPPPAEPPAAAHAQPDEDETRTWDGPGAVSVAGRVRQDLIALASMHPAADTLTEVATLLAVTLDAPQTRADPRAVAAVSKELRATLADLVRVEEAGDADAFGLDDVPTPVVVPPAG